MDTGYEVTIVLLGKTPVYGPVLVLVRAVAFTNKQLFKLSRTILRNNSAPCKAVPYITI